MTGSYLKRPQHLSIFLPPVSGLPLMVGRSTKQAVACFVHEIDLHEIFECAHFKFTVYGHKHATTYIRMYTHTLPQCSPASVGLAQARPNKQFKADVDSYIL